LVASHVSTLQRQRQILSHLGFDPGFRVGRLLHGLDRFREVVLDFRGVEGIGQGFADEIFRVWAGAHPDVSLEAANMNEAVGFMVERTRRHGRSS
jgi:hypothetical protein